MTRPLKPLIIVFLSILFPLMNVFAQSKTDTISAPPANESKLNLSNCVLQTDTDTLKVQIISSEKENLPSNKPWIIALIVGALTFIATITASLINKWVAIRGINNSKEIALQQIKSQLNVTLKTKNRQDWVTELRTTLSEFLTDCKMLNAEFQEQDLNIERQKSFHEKVTFSRNKIRLLLNPKKERHNELLTALFDLINVLDEHMLNSKNSIGTYKNLDFMKRSDSVIDIGRELLYDEWQKIQSENAS